MYDVTSENILYCRVVDRDGGARGEEDDKQGF